MSQNIHNETPTVRFNCPECDELVSEFVDVPFYKESSDKDLEVFSYNEVVINCDFCRSNFTIEIHATDHITKVNLSGHPHIHAELLNDPAKWDDEYDSFAQEYDHYLNEYVPTQPDLVYKLAIKELEIVHKKIKQAKIETDAVFRMLFIQYFSAIEAYLSDRLVKIINDDKKALGKLILGHKELKKETITFEDIINNPDKITESVKLHLRTLLYHNFPKIDHYYIATLGKSIFSKADDSGILMRFAKMRHDCVHRNGRDHEGKLVRIAEREVRILAETIERTVLHIEKSYEEKYEFNKIFSDELEFVEIDF